MSIVADVCSSLTFISGPAQMRLCETKNIRDLEQFKNKIAWFNTFEKNFQQIEKELFASIPIGLKIQEVIEVIFEESYDAESCLCLLDAVFVKHSSCAASPFNIIRRAIVEDTGFSLNNRILVAKLKVHGLSGCEEKIAACYDLAYRMNHPYICCPSQETVPTKDYTLNFLWVNLNPQDRVQDRALSIFGEGLDPFENAACIKDSLQLRILERIEQSLEKRELKDWERVKKSFGYRISKWADVNPGSRINLWFDSALVTQKAQQNTFEMMKSISQSRNVSLVLRDVRRLPNITDELKKSLHPGTPVFFRVDLLKVLITDYMIGSSTEPAKYCVVSDVDVEPLSSKQLFDRRTVKFLSENGYVFNGVGFDRFENSFFIFNTEKKGIQEDHFEAVVQPIEKTIRAARDYPVNVNFRSSHVLDSQFVFNQYVAFLQRRMEEKGGFSTRSKDVRPRKVVVCPRSQFILGGNFSKSEHQAESFRFIGSSDVPYTKNGRTCEAYGEKQIDTLINWKVGPLDLGPEEK